MMTSRIPFALAVLALSLGTVPFGLAHASEGKTPEAKGLAIAQESREKNRGFGNLKAHLTMVLRNKQKKESRRQLRVQTLEVKGAGDRNLLIFDYPKNVKGTALLAHSYKTKDDDQWLYLPALKRVKRISSSNRSGSFMGSEFSYEDLSTPEVEKYTYKYLRDETCGELKLTCSVSEQIPTSKGSGYSRQVVWRDRDELRSWKVEFYDRKGSHLKTLTATDYKKYLDRYWRAEKMEMVNHLTGKSTVLLYKDFVFNAKMNPKDFTRMGLKRTR
ncbi:MAG: outer membrane lipoprotein-sorting protein [Bacteriovoracales bacterium]|nr:outer membrane lipoprotein-sorting protein [Bacteriovoracales bacterium]